MVKVKLKEINFLPIVNYFCDLPAMQMVYLRLKGILVFKLTIGNFEVILNKNNPN